MRTRASPLLRLAVALSGLALALQYQPRPLAAQDLTLPATLLKRLGSAVDGYRDGQKLWVVISINPPHNILGVRYSLEAARDLVPRGPSSYQVMGPYVAPPDSPGVPLTVTAFCKLPDTGACGVDSLPTPIPINSIDTIEVTFKLVGGGRRTVVYKPRDVEAVFFTLSAIDKLLVPYYTGIYGVDTAQRLRQQYFSFFTGRH
jgi:hypothetical protein